MIYPDDYSYANLHLFSLFYGIPSKFILNMIFVKVYQGPFNGQDLSPILGVQEKHITCITLMLTLINVELV